jgi:hypothetical protein
LYTGWYLIRVLEKFEIMKQKFSVPSNRWVLADPLTSKSGRDRGFERAVVTKSAHADRQRM